MDRVKVLHILGIDDTNTVEVVFLSPEVRNLRHKYLGNVDLLPLLERMPDLMTSAGPPASLDPPLSRAENAYW